MRASTSDLSRKYSHTCFSGSPILMLIISESIRLTFMKFLRLVWYCRDNNSLLSLFVFILILFYRSPPNPRCCFRARQAVNRNELAEHYGLCRFADKFIIIVQCPSYHFNIIPMKGFGIPFNYHLFFSCPYNPNKAIRTACVC